MLLPQNLYSSTQYILLYKPGIQTHQSSRTQRYQNAKAIMVQKAISTNFKNSYQLIETCFALETCTVALSTSYSINLGCKLIKSKDTCYSLWSETHIC